MTAPVLSASDLRLAFGTQVLLDGAGLAVGAGEKLGLVGRNGCGKSSLLKILGGVSRPDAGQVSLRRGLRVGYLPQEFELPPSATVEECIAGGAADLREWIRRYERGEGSEPELAEWQHRIEAADGWNLETRVRSLAGALNAPRLDAAAGDLSGGEKRRVALARALVGQPDLLLLDEPTNHLDADTIAWLGGFLGEFPGALIFVTHDRYFLEDIATRIVELSGGRCYSHPGNYTAYLEARAARRQVAEQTERRRQRFLRVELEWVKAGVRAQRSKSRHRLESFYEVEGLAAPPEEREMDLLIPPPPELGNLAVELAGASARVGEGSEGRWLFRGLDLVIRPGECTGIVGRNGSGKTTLLKLCMGDRPPDEGRVTVAKKARFNYIDQGRMQLDGDRTVMAEIADAGEAVHFGEQTLSVRGYLRRFLFPESRVNERVDTLSGGERARLMLAKVLKRGGNVLVLDEPTNDLDLGSLRMLEEALARFGGAVLVVSHDRYFLDRICDRIVALEESGVHIQPGNYSYYLEKRAAREAAWRAGAPAAPARKPARTAPAASGPARKLTYKEQRELEGMEASILAAEGRADEIEGLLNDPAFFVARSAEAPGLVAELERLRQDIARLYARWEELESLSRRE